jgi:hypothetical protein
MKNFYSEIHAIVDIASFSTVVQYLDKIRRVNRYPRFSVKDLKTNFHFCGDSFNADIIGFVRFVLHLSIE